MVDFIIVVILLAIIAAATAYIIKAKKSGAKCIGCPLEGGCSHKCGEASGCSCGCGGENTKESSCSCHTDTK